MIYKMITRFQNELQNKNDRKDSLQIYIPTNNLLNEDNFGRLLKQIKYAKDNQSRKKKFVNKDIEADYSKTNENNEGKHIIDKTIYTLRLFEGIAVLPTNVIVQLYPFKGTERRTYISGFNLYTDNEEFFDFMNTVLLCNDELQVNGNVIYVENQNEKLIEIVKFFR